MNRSRKAKVVAFITSWLIALIASVLFVNVPVMAQAVTGTLRGTVTDANGAVVPGAKPGKGGSVARIGAGSAREERPDLSAFPSFNLERFEYDFRRVSNLDLESF